jgi:hypothetical protein
MYLMRNMKGVAVISTRVYSLLTQKYQLLGAIPPYCAAVCGEQTGRLAHTEVIPCQSTFSRVAEQTVQKSEERRFCLISE